VDVFTNCLQNVYNLFTAQEDIKLHGRGD